jgi:hypothetical protein
MTQFLDERLSARVLEITRCANTAEIRKTQEIAEGKRIKRLKRQQQERKEKYRKRQCRARRWRGRLRGGRGDLSGGCESDGRKPSSPLVALAVVAALGCGFALSQGDLLFVAIFAAACGVTIIEAIRRLQ